MTDTPVATAPSPKAVALAQAKRRAEFFLIGAAALFVLSLFWRGPPAWVTGLLQAVAEAAMVGGLADWFAVSALFRPVKLLGVIPIFPAHTAVIPRNKGRIAGSLGDFVRDHFLQPQALVAMVRRHDPARYVADWFQAPRNAERFGRHGARLVSWVLDGLHEESVQALVAKVIRQAMQHVDLSRTAGEALDAMLAQGRHHDLLNETIAKVAELLRDPDTRATIANKIAEGIRDQYPKGQLLLPTEAIGRKVARDVADWVERYLEEVSQQPGHALREAFDAKARALAGRLKHDSRFIQKGEDIKAYILGDEKFTGYIRSLWTSLRDMVARDLADPGSRIHQKLVEAGGWIGTTLDNDPELRASLNHQIEALVEQFGPGLGEFVSSHIESTIQGWDAVAMSELIEENIGTDLQKIRINGTVIGGVLGGVLFGITLLASHGR